MGTIGRKNVHGKGGVRFKTGYTAAKRKSMLRTAVTDLIIHEEITVTFATAKELSALADKMITFGKRGDLHSRRLAAAVVRDTWADEKAGVTALQKLFNDVAPRYKDRNGGYTRVLKTQNRRGDNAPMAIVALVK